MAHTRPGATAKAARKARIARKAALRATLDKMYDQFDADFWAWSEEHTLTAAQVTEREALLWTAIDAVRDELAAV